MARLVSYLIALFSLGRATSEIPIRSSDYTNMVTQVQVGTPEQTILVGLAFDTSDSWLYPVGECPPFVSCFRQALSASFIRLNDQGVLLEVFSVTGRIIYLKYFASTSVTSPSVPYRDVAGRLAFGPNAELGLLNRLLIKADLPVEGKKTKAQPRWHVEANPVIPALDADEMEVTGHVLAYSDMWTVSSELFIGMNKIFKRVSLAVSPNVNDLVIPAASQVLFLKYFYGRAARVSPDGRFYVECTSEDSPKANLSGLQRVDLRFFPDTSLYVSIMPQHLIYTGSHSFSSIYLPPTGERFCPTRVVFRAGTNIWVVGVPLIASVKSVLLDGPARKVRLRFTRSQEQRPVSIVAAARPIFELHKIEEFSEPAVMTVGSGHEAQTTIELGTEWQSVGNTDSYILQSTSPFSPKPGIFVFTLFKKRSGFLPYKAQQAISEELPGSLQIQNLEMKLAHAPGNLFTASIALFAATDLTRAGYSVTIIRKADRMHIVLTTTKLKMDIEHYILPEPEIQGPLSQDADSCICILCSEETQEGNRLQNLPCGHGFHWSCIMNWLVYNPLCPDCQERVPLKPTAILSRVDGNAEDEVEEELTAEQESDESDYDCEEEEESEGDFDEEQDESDGLVHGDDFEHEDEDGAGNDEGRVAPPGNDRVAGTHI